MLKSILAVIVSCAMLSGAGSVPATPDAAVRTTVDNIVFYAGGESVELDHAVEFTAAVGSDESEIEFALTKDGESVLPVRAKITPDELTFALSEGGSAYSVSGDFAAEYIGLYEEDIEILNAAAQIIERVPEIFPANSHMEYAQELYSVIESQAAAEKSSGTIDLGGEIVDCEEIVLRVENGADFAFADAMRESETDHLSAFMQLLLDMMNATGDETYASFAEMGVSMSDSDEYTMLKGETGAGVIAYLLFVNSDNGEAGMSMYFNFTPNAFSAKLDLAEEDETENRIEYSCELKNGEIVAANLAYDYEYASYEDGTYENSVSAKCDYTVAGGLAERNFSYESRNYYSFQISDDFNYSYSDDVRVSGSANDRADENGGIVTGVDADIRTEYNYDGSNPTKLAAKLTFDIRTEKLPWQDSFAGANVVAIESEDDIPPQLMGDTLMFSSQLALLQYDEKISALSGLLEKAVEEIVDIEETEDISPGIDEGKLKKRDERVAKPDALVMPDKTEAPAPGIDEGKLKKKDKPAKPDALVMPDKTEAPAPAIDGEGLQAGYGTGSGAGEDFLFPDFTPPEGYVLDTVDESAYDLFRTYYDADGNLLDFYAGSVTHGRTYNHSQIELPEGASGMPVKLYYNDEGLIYGASFTKEDFYINIYSEAGVSLEEMEAMINSVS